jgi:branched-chain amino acid transport system substrate-binding protein
MSITRRSLLVLPAAVLAPGRAGAQPADIPVGVPMALTGPYAFVGVPIRNGIVTALEQANAAGTLWGRIRIIEADDGSDKGQAVTLTNRMATVDKVLIMLGPTSSIEGTAAAPVANDLHLPMLTSAVSADVLKAGPWSFKVTSSPADIMAELGRHAAGPMGVRRAVFVFNRDNDGFVAQKNATRDTMKAASVAVLGEEGILGSDTDFVALSTKLADSGADCLYVGTPAEQGANLIIQARQAGLPDGVKIISPPSMASAAFIKAGGKAVEGTVVVADYFEGADTPMNKAFVTAYRAKYKLAPDNWAAVGYTLGSLAVDALKAAGPGADRERVRAALAGIKASPTVLGNGTYSLDAERVPHYGAAIIVVRDGAFAEAK